MQFLADSQFYLQFLIKSGLKTIKLKRIKFLIFHIKYPKNDISWPRKDFFYMKSVIFQEGMPVFLNEWLSKTIIVKKIRRDFFTKSGFSSSISWK